MLLSVPGGSFLVRVICEATLRDPQVRPQRQANLRVRIPKCAGVTGSPLLLSPHPRTVAPTPARTRQRPPPRPAPARIFTPRDHPPDEIANLIKVRRAACASADPERILSPRGSVRRLCAGSGGSPLR